MLSKEKTVIEIESDEYALVIRSDGDTHLYVPFVDTESEGDTVSVDNATLFLAAVLDLWNDSERVDSFINEYINKMDQKHDD